MWQSAALTYNMEKPKIYATGNENLSGNFNVSYYIIEKEEKFLDWLGELLVTVLDIEDGNRRAKFLVKRNDDDGEPEEIIPKKIAEMIDEHEHYENKKERIDIFYGSTRVYMTLRKSKELRKKFADFVLKTKDWIKVEEIKPEKRKVIEAG
jgi:hypothetical protein